MPEMTPDALRAFCDRPPQIVAPELIGATLMLAGAGGMIVETEAYASGDPASHSFSGQTSRNAAMFGRPASAYVYLSYGIHWCFNIVCQPGSAVLVRALESLTGFDEMAARRGVSDPRKLCSGPGKLCQALGIDISHNGLDLDGGVLRLMPGEGGFQLLCGRRIGITRAVEREWRFGLAGSPFLSRRFPATARQTPG